ncbi:MAG: p-cresol methylhydroxylase [SAR86 cluster bacterium]|uniref:p-cresol methylhydroxylase n=1 Tax=SAR86 cluster bacterium TaxID=2030880 RepID=A0A2A5C7D7_9GAMM|nr:cytochrome c [Gammaproteobacteria bacterium AH-315-E17]PCJ39388.1 MAG: p-cresol methylhydroxylase [SAR86 cluster bacterium]
MKSVYVIVLLMSFSLPVLAQDQDHGQEIFNLWCSSCHRVVPAGTTPVAGTGSLERRYQGSLPAALEQRTDLSPEYIRIIVRTGIKSMPFTRKSEISDSDLDDLVAYLTRER